MSKLLKITKSDKTVHVVPLANKAFYLSYNNRLPADQKWKLEEIDEKEAKNIPFIDDSHVTPMEAVSKVKQLQSANEEKDAEIERLKALLAQQQTASQTQSPAHVSTTAPKKSTAEEVIALINVAVSVEQVENLVKDDERKTVKEAAEKKIAALQA